MHERAVMLDLMRKIEAEGAAAGGGRVIAVRVRLGALSHFTVDHFRVHFEDVARGTSAEGARVEATLATDPTASDAQGVMLQSIEVEA
jgi:hydrogenase nickel incorporation protein HypA/HybF